MQPASRHATLPASCSLALLVVLTACTGLPGQHREASPDGHTVTREEILESGAENAWEAIGRTTRLSTSPNGRLRHRGEGSISLDDTPVIILDGARISDTGVLVQLPAWSLASIIVLSGVQATTRYGTNAQSGVVVLTTYH